LYALGSPWRQKAKLAEQRRQRPNRTGHSSSVLWSTTRVHGRSIISDELVRLGVLALKSAKVP
jgi:hypothetical protein